LKSYDHNTKKTKTHFYTMATGIEYRTTVAFHGDTRAQQLSFGEDEIILVSESDLWKRNKNGWGRGKLLSSNQCGWFNMDHVEPFMPGLAVPVKNATASEIVIIEELHPSEVPKLNVEEEENKEDSSAVQSALLSLDAQADDLNGATVKESDHGNKKLLIEVRSSFQKAGSRISSAASLTGSRISSAASTAGSSISSMAASAKSSSSTSSSSEDPAESNDGPERKPVNAAAVRESFRKVGTGLSTAANMTGSRISSAASTAGSSISSLVASTKNSSASTSSDPLERNDGPERKAINPVAVRESFRKVGTGLSTAARHERERISSVASKTGSMISQAASSTGSFLSHGLQNDAAAPRNSCSDGSNEEETEHPTEEQEQPDSKTNTSSSTAAVGGWFRLGGQQRAAAAPVTNTDETSTATPPSAPAPSRLQQVVAGSAGKLAPFKAAMDRSLGNMRQSTKPGEASDSTRLSVEGQDDATTEAPPPAPVPS
jgi:hypothetical protein